MGKVVLDEPHALYRFYGAGGTLLYIGITNSIPVRLKRHSSEKAWWTGVTNITLEHYPDRLAVLEAERRAIIAERPLYNEVHNPTPLRRDDLTEWAMDVLRQRIDPVQLARAISDARFDRIPEELVPIHAAGSLLDHFESELENLAEAVEELLAILPPEGVAYLQRLADENHVDRHDLDLLAGFVRHATDWLKARKTVAGA